MWAQPVDNPQHPPAPDSPGATLLLGGPVLDYLLAGSWVHEYSFEDSGPFQVQPDQSPSAH